MRRREDLSGEAVKVGQLRPADIPPNRGRELLELTRGDVRPHPPAGRADRSQAQDARCPATHIPLARAELEQDLVAEHVGTRGARAETDLFALG